MDDGSSINIYICVPTCRVDKVVWTAFVVIDSDKCGVINAGPCLRRVRLVRVIHTSGFKTFQSTAEELKQMCCVRQATVIKYT